MNDFQRDFYKKTEGHKAAIFYEGTEPTLYVRDLDLIKRVMIRDFDHFMDFGFFPEDIATLKVNDFGVANTMGEEWRSLKATISPAFSMSNMKMLAQQVDKNARKTVASLKKRGDPGSAVEVEQLSMNYTMDCIARICFSMEIDSNEDPNNEFCAMGNKFMEVWRLILSVMTPWVAKMFNVAIMNPKATIYFEERDAAGDADKYKDILGLMMKARDGGNIGEGLADEAAFSGVKKSHMTNDIINRTVMQFFVDGYDTTGSQISATLYFLAVNPEVQESAYEEVEEIASRCASRELTGEDVNDMKYIDQVVSEAARFVAVPNTFRKCTKDWPLPGYPDVVIPAGMRVSIPVHPLQMDPEFFEDPELFNPDRFSAENRGSVKAGTYMPFGMGPRQCMGMKIARMETKVLIYELLKEFRIEPSDKTPPSLKGHLRKDHMAKISGGNWLKFTPRN